MMKDTLLLQIDDTKSCHVPTTTDHSFESSAASIAQDRLCLGVRQHVLL